MKHFKRSKHQSNNMLEYKILLIPIIGFIIGYLTNYLAVKMLFHPKKRILGIQGVLPRRRQQIAQRIGDASIHLLPAYIKDIQKIPFIGDKAIDYLKEAVEKQVNSLSLDELEEIVLKVAKGELRFITWVGGVLGFIIGLVQVLFFLV